MKMKKWAVVIVGVLIIPVLVHLDPFRAWNRFFCYLYPVYFYLMPACISLVARNYKIIFCNIILASFILLGSSQLGMEGYVALVLEHTEVIIIVWFALLIWSLWSVSRKYNAIFAGMLFLGFLIIYVIISFGYAINRPQGSGLRAVPDNIGEEYTVVQQNVHR